MNYLFLIVLFSITAQAPAQILTPKADSPMRPSGIKSEPTTALGWFRSADNLTNIRMPGSAPFHMKVAFHGYPGIDFAPKGKSTIMTGDGIYEETWVSPESWRREVTFGAYHAVEVRTGGVRKFQTSSDYEPSRVLMTLRALLAPVPRLALEPELDDLHLRWRVEHKTAGNLAYIRVAFNQCRAGGCLHPVTSSFDLLPTGVLVRSVDVYGLITGWEDDRVFASRLVPRKFTIQAMGNNLVTATVSIDPLPPDEHTIEQLAGPAAEPGDSLRSLDDFWNHREVRTFPEQSAINLAMPHLNSDPGLQFPEGAYVAVIAVIDRSGIAHEAEWTDVVKVQTSSSPRGPSDMTAYSVNAKSMLDTFMKSRFKVPTVDGAPCEVLTMLAMAGGPVNFSGMR